MSLSGSGPPDPQRVGVPIVDLLAGMNGAFGVLAALVERDRSGKRQIVPHWTARNPRHRQATNAPSHRSRA